MQAELWWPFGDLEPRKYGTILADPPWQMKMWSDKGKGRSPDGLVPGSRPQSYVARHYTTMTIAQMRQLPVGILAADDCILLMWAIDPMIPEAIELGRLWGFTYKTVGFYWVKERRTTSRRGKGLEDEWAQRFPMGTGYWTRANPEQCLLFTRGQPKRLNTGVRKLIVEPRREHSRKPEQQYDRIERLVTGPYAELFSRSARPGWDAWGDQLGRFGATDSGSAESEASI